MSGQALAGRCRQSAGLSVGSDCLPDNEWKLTWSLVCCAAEIYHWRQSRISSDVLLLNRSTFWSSVVMTTRAVEFAGCNSCQQEIQELGWCPWRYGCWPWYHCFLAWCGSRMAVFTWLKNIWEDTVLQSVWLPAGSHLWWGGESTIRLSGQL